jgi:murein DD-endopeptidase MepM/ murein hydrolase activator NlpD
MHSVFPLILLQSSVSCLLFGTLVWGALSVAERVWPGLGARRAPWLLALAGTACAFVLVMSPLASRLASLPAPPAANIAVVSGAAFEPALAQSADADELTESPWLARFALAWLACYCAGVLVMAARWQRGRRALQALLQAAQPLAAGALLALDGKTGRRTPVLEIDAPISPMLVGLAHPVLLLPHHLRSFSHEEQGLIIAHELTHLRRRDQLWLHAGLLLRSLLWFNPMALHFFQRLTWAQELGCDRDVLAGSSQQTRKCYAQALLAQLGRQQRAGGPAVSMAFGGATYRAVAQRIERMRQTELPAPGPLAKAAALAGLTALLAACVVLQPAFAWRVEHAAALAQAMPAAAQQTWRAPLAHLRVSQFFGVAQASGKTHGGIDFAAPAGTSVMAPAAATVVVSTDRYEGGAKFGKVIVLEHANGMRSLYAHLDRRAVQVGDAVQAGQVIAQSGATGRVTGPHLHMEALRHGEHVDPLSLMGGLGHSATPSALADRSH